MQALHRRHVVRRRTLERHAAVGRLRNTGTSIKEIHMQGKIKLLTLPFLVAALAAATTTAAFNDKPAVRASADTASAKAGGLLQGRLNVRYGDGRPGPGRTSKTVVRLIEDNGRIHLIDAASAKRAAGDLHLLANRRVAVSVAAIAQGKAADSAPLLTAEAIVPIDDLDADAAQGRAGDVSIAAVTGTKAWVTVMCRFKDNTSTPRPLSYFVDMYANTSGRLDHYWRNMSYGKINLTGSTASGWYTLPQNRAYYFPSTGEPRWDELRNNCLGAANPNVNYANFFGINMIFNGDMDGYAYGGTETLTYDGVTKNWGLTWNPPWAYRSNVVNDYEGINTLAHEMGHAFGMPHSDNMDGDGDTYDNAWDIMSGGYDEVFYDATYGRLPQNPIVYQRDLMGWFDAARVRNHTRLNATTTYTMDRASLQGSANVQMVKLIVPNSTTYYTIEVRKTAGPIYDSRLPGDSVIIHRVTDRARIVDARVPPHDYSNQETNMFKVGESYTTPEATGSRYRVEVLTATTAGFTVRVTNL
ncbi:hypothetical protein [Lysobacter brunescens]|uniref:M6 family metalloprotease domain-containing protein n=1 Tax=Lysobacter brunescens TaxID=262323 RepID=A0ABW2YG63_9GAMM